METFFSRSGLVGVASGFATLFILLGAPVVLAAAPMCNGLEATLYVDENNLLVEDGVIGGAYTGTLIGDSGTDVIVGTEGDDVIDASNGNNTICSLGGNDTITGGNSTDWIDAGSGNNKVDSGSGANVIMAADGNNIIGEFCIGDNSQLCGGGQGEDTITTGSGNDTINAGNGNNTINAGDGTNIVITGNQDSTVTTGNGNDKITGGNGQNNIRGGAGNDVIFTTSNQSDTIDGGLGYDFCDAEEGDNIITNCEAVDGNEGNGQMAGLIITKDSQPDSSQGFTFTATGFTPASFSLVDNGGINYTSYVNVAPGSYVITETITSGWTLASISCTDPDGGTSVNLDTRTATIDFDAGEAIVCVFVNTAIVSENDIDGDGVNNAADNCPATANSNQLNTDGDSMGDVCDTDDDGDTILDDVDNCPITANLDQADNDDDGTGNVCDSSPNPPTENDSDGDGALNPADNCPLVANADQLDTDGDGQGDACDTDDDNDTVLDTTDNCPITANANQTDTDSDGLGNACDPDDDNDGDLDGADNCPLIANADQADNDEDGIGNLCDSTPSGTSIGGGRGGSSSGSSQQFIITSSAGAGGSITPVGSYYVAAGSSYTVGISPDSGFQIAGVLVDEIPVGAVSFYTFSNVSVGHTISASFQGVAGIATQTFQSGVSAVEKTGGARGTSSEAEGQVAGEASTDSEKPEVSESEPPIQPAALSGAGGLGALWDWLKMNWPWWVILLVILLLLYWRFTQIQKAKKNQPPK